MKNIELE
jgi:hypothetical protein